MGYSFKLLRYNTIQYDTTKEFKVDSKAECEQLNLAHEIKTKNTSAHLVQYRLKIHEGSPERIRRLRRKGFVKETSFKPRVKDRGSDRWWKRRWWLWWGDMCRIRWTRRRVNRMRLTERRGGSWYHRWGDPIYFLQQSLRFSAENPTEKHHLLLNETTHFLHWPITEVRAEPRWKTNLANFHLPGGCWHQRFTKFSTTNSCVSYSNAFLHSIDGK